VPQSGRDVVLALDVGSGGTRVVAYDLDGHPLTHAEADYVTYHDRIAWAEQEPEDWWVAALQALQMVTRQLRHDDSVRALGLTGQSPTIAPFDREGRPVRRAMIYQDNRATREAEEWIERVGDRATVHQRTGHDPAAFYIGPKVLWVRRHEPHVFAEAYVWLQPRDFVAWRLTGVCATDWSHAGSTLLFDVVARAWAADIFASVDLPPEIFPPVLEPWAVLGGLRTGVAGETGLPCDLPVIIGGADSQCCAVGAGVLDPGQLSDMAGTSTCLNAPVPAPLADLRIANYCHVAPGWWCTELGLNASGAAYEWLATFAVRPHETPTFAWGEEEARRSAPGAHGLIFLPYMADGERFDPRLRGGFCDLSLRHTYGDMTRAVFEGVAFAIREHVQTMAEAGARIGEIHVSGGGARVDLWNRIKADVTGVPVVSVESDATSLGVALVAGTAIGLHPSLDAAVRRCVRVDRRYEPHRDLDDLYADRYDRFRTLARATAADTDGR